MDSRTYAAVQNVFASQGVPDYVWYPIMIMESGGNPNAVGDGGVSIGLFQLNTAGGQGTGYNPGYLKDPVVNAEVASRAIAPAYNAIKDRYLPQSMAAQVALRSGHPGGSISHPLSGPAATNASARLENLSRAFLSGSSAASAAVGSGGGSGSGSSGGGLGLSIPNPLDAFSGVNDFFKGLSEGIPKFDFIGAGLVLLGVVLLLLVLAAAVTEKAAPVVAPIARAAVTKGVL